MIPEEFNEILASRKQVYITYRAKIYRKRVLRGVFEYWPEKVTTFGTVRPVYVAEEDMDHIEKHPECVYFPTLIRMWGKSAWRNYDT